MAEWGKTVITGRARLGGLPMGERERERGRERERERERTAG
jgi:hypothetical protein